MKLRQCKLAFS